MDLDVFTVPDLCSRNKAISNLEKKRKKKKKEEEEEEEEEGPYGQSFLWRSHMSPVSQVKDGDVSVSADR
ncbi:hypothetical protein INR49_009498 [Caranx melampygus]|nr:hypothetical protein INR49_009498 [Caranx melampygus]